MSLHVGQYKRTGFASISFMNRLHLPHLEKGLPAELKSDFIFKLNLNKENEEAFTSTK